MASFLNGRTGLGLAAALSAPLLAAAAANASVVTLNYVVTNTSDSVQSYSILATAPQGALPGTLITGSVTGTVTDLNGDGATVTSVDGGWIYNALLDGVTVRTLLGPGYTFSSGQYLSNTAGPEGFVLELSGPVTTDIGIRLDFTLTPGDSASFTSIFTVEIPAPGAAGLIGLAALVGLRRRRH
jgi:uncharacterized protein (TIGR03382 family)